MKFGKEFKTHLEETLPEWRDKYLCYKLLKKVLKHIPNSSTTADSAALNLPPSDGDDVAAPLTELQDWFIKILNDELEKFNDFYVDKEEEFIIRLQELKERIERLKDKGSKKGLLTSETEFSEEIMDIRKDFVSIHGEMVLLKNYSSLNFAGLIKILKKYDKRTGGLLRLPFTQLALHQPFFTTEPLTRLVRECEANLELLFPLKAEVIESTPAVPVPIPHDQIGETSRDVLPNISAETTLAGEETVDIYRSTLAAIRTIQGLKKASSTYNPLSFSVLFGNQDTENTGVVTAENSADSLASLPIPNEEEETFDDEAARSPT